MKTLAGLSKVVKDDEYEIIVHVPDGLRVLDVGNESHPASLRKLGKTHLVHSANFIHQR